MWDGASLGSPSCSSVRVHALCPGISVLMGLCQNDKLCCMGSSQVRLGKPGGPGLCHALGFRRAESLLPWLVSGRVGSQCECQCLRYHLESRKNLAPL